MKSFPAKGMFNLPEHISERCEIVGAKNKITSNGPVVIWLKSSLRVHENPAIDAGRLIASSLDYLSLFTKALMRDIHMPVPGITKYYSMLPLIWKKVARD